MSRPPPCLFVDAGRMLGATSELPCFLYSKLVFFRTIKAKVMGFFPVVLWCRLQVTLLDSLSLST